MKFSLNKKIYRERGRCGDSDMQRARVGLGERRRKKGRRERVSTENMILHYIINNNRLASQHFIANIT